MYNKQNVVNNIQKMINENFYELYAKYASDNLNKENLSALIFNSILLASQLLDDEDLIKNLVIDFIEENIYSSDGNISFFDNPDYELPKMLSKHSNITYSEILERLKHGFAVHFTTPNIMKIIKENKSLSSTNQLYSRETEELFRTAYEIQSKNTNNVYNGLMTGFGTGKGISMSSQTNGYWMNHTPESLSFLFGGRVYTRDKEAAFDYISSVINTLDIELQNKLLKELNEIWDKFVGEDRYLGAILIDRDGIEYEKVTYWSENPPRVEEQRPYKHNLMDITSNENSRVNTDINIEYLSFIKVPSIPMLEEYRINNSIHNTL